ncbi:DUF4252 domain-containing protein [Algoriphagus aestuariicola]|uniref:DUF4252 domain-containing protein n=1 Tax=Algoriphagus aestuariicola TaxID=1852016 RepID=A0ABS3BSI2_9BACT|nr:DUF4252 domain-containing protein [Algoriphagus aestuariicola]MBN7801784.1 DUF4252 domain-containing protein [Algoriphagus aestuariicola]
MKKLLLSLAVFAAALAAHAQSNSVAALKDKYKTEEDFFHLELGGNFMNFAEGFKVDIDKDDMAAVAKSVEKLNFFTLPDGPNSFAEFKALQKGLEKERYELLMEASEGKGGVMVYSKGAKIISDLVILVGDEKEGDLMVIELKGKFTQESLDKATSHLN